MAVKLLEDMERLLGVALDDLQLSETGAVTGKRLNFLLCSLVCLFVSHYNRPRTYHINVYIGPRVVSLGGGEREVSIVVLAGDFAHLAIAFSNDLVYCFCVIRSSVVLEDNIFGSSLAWGFERLVIPLVEWYLTLLGDEDEVNLSSS